MSHDEEYIEEIRVVRRKKDTYRSNSSKSDEFESDLLRSMSTKNVAGPTESRSVDEEELRQRYQGDPTYITSGSSDRELTPGQKAVADAIVEIGAVVFRELVVPLVTDVVAPAAKAKFNELAERRRVRALERAEAKARAAKLTTAKLEVVDEPQGASSSTDVEAAEPAIPIRRSDLLLAALQLKLAEEYVTRQRWLVMHAEVTDDDVPPALEQALTRMLEGRTDELGEDEREAIAVFLQQANTSPSSAAPLPSAPSSDAP